MAVVAMLLLITCANVVELLLARSNAREREMAVRLAIGAGKFRLMRQLMLESLLLGLIGGALGIALAFWEAAFPACLMARGRSQVLLSVHPDLTVLAFALMVSLLTAVVFGTIPAWRSTDVDPARSLAQNARSSTSARRAPRPG